MADHGSKARYETGCRCRQCKRNHSRRKGNTPTWWATDTVRKKIQAEVGEAWKDRGLCKGDKSFFPPAGKGSSVTKMVRRAKAICQECPVREECLAYGMHERSGVWGGTSENERRILRRERRDVSPIPRHVR